MFFWIYQVLIYKIHYLAKKQHLKIHIFRILFTQPLVKIERGLTILFMMNASYKRITSCFNTGSSTYYYFVLFSYCRFSSRQFSALTIRGDCSTTSSISLFEFLSLLKDKYFFFCISPYPLPCQNYNSQELKISWISVKFPSNVHRC